MSIVMLFDEAILYELMTPFFGITIARCDFVCLRTDITVIFDYLREVQSWRKATNIMIIGLLPH